MKIIIEKEKIVAIIQKHYESILPLEEGQIISVKFQPYDDEVTIQVMDKNTKRPESNPQEIEVNGVKYIVKPKEEKTAATEENPADF